MRGWSDYNDLYSYHYKQPCTLNQWFLNTLSNQAHHLSHVLFVGIAHSLRHIGNPRHDVTMLTTTCTDSPGLVWQKIQEPLAQGAHFLRVPGAKSMLSFTSSLSCDSRPRCFNPLHPKGRFSCQHNKSVRYVHSCLKFIIPIPMSTSSADWSPALTHWSQAQILYYKLACSNI